MGWDAYAIYPDGKEIVFDRKKNKIKDDKLDAAFAAANEIVVEKVGIVDGLLRQAGLDCSDCACQLQEHTGVDAWREYPMTPEEVRAAASDLRWDCEPEDDETWWAFYSAKMFIKTCAAEGLAVRFSF